MELIAEAMGSGCRQFIACQEMDLSERTYHRWRDQPCGDLRRGPLTTPANKLSQAEKEEVLKKANSKEFFDLPPTQIVPSLADRGEYVAFVQNRRFQLPRRFLVARPRPPNPDYSLDLI